MLPLIDLSARLRLVANLATVSPERTGSQWVRWPLSGWGLTSVRGKLGAGLRNVMKGAPGQQSSLTLSGAPSLVDEATSRSSNWTTKCIIIFNQIKIKMFLFKRKYCFQPSPLPLLTSLDATGLNLTKT